MKDRRIAGDCVFNFLKSMSKIEDHNPAFPDHALLTKGSKINFENESRHFAFIVAPTMHVPIHDTVLGTAHHNSPMPTNTHMFSYPRGNERERERETVV